MIYPILKRLVVPRAFQKIRRVDGLEHLPKDGPFILTANHVSWLDPVYLTAAVSRRFRKRILFIGAAAKHRWTQAVIPIRKQHPARTVEVALTHLRRGRAIGIFPRGDQRCPLNRPKTGAARLGRSSGFPIIPVALHALVPGHVFRSLHGFFNRSHTMEIRFGAPIRLPFRPARTKKELFEDMHRVEMAIQSLLYSLQRR